MVNRNTELEIAEIVNRNKNIELSEKRKENKKKETEEKEKLRYMEGEKLGQKGNIGKVRNTREKGNKK